MTRTDIDETRTTGGAPSVDDERRDELDRSLERSKVREGFAWHLGTYVIMMGFFSVIAWMSGSGYHWVIWVAIPWGLAVAFHALAFVIQGTRLFRLR